MKAKMKEFLNSQAFYDLMQNYRICPITEQDRTTKHFEGVKEGVMQIVSKEGDIPKAKNSEEAFRLGEHYKGKPHGWIQWKGTNVCMDIHCKCGEHMHIDADFAYHVKCGACGTVYACNGHIQLIELEETPDSCVVVSEQ